MPGQRPEPGSLLCFDFGGTLDADGKSWNSRFHVAYRAAGGTLSGDHFDALFAEAETNLGRARGIRSAGFRETVEGLALLLGEMLPDTTGEALTRIANKVHQDAVAVARRNRTLLKRLASRYRLAVISNFHGNLVPCLRDLGLLSFFEYVADSGVIGIRKADRRLFERTLARLHVLPSNSWMIGDDPDLDILPASILGMRTCAIGLNRPPPRGVRPTLTVAGMKELARRWGR